MKLFQPDAHTQSDEHRKIYALCEIAYSIVDFSAAFFFVVGSILFFNESTTFVATWLFVIGSVFFGLRPTIRLYRELAYLRLGDYQSIADR